MDTRSWFMLACTLLFFYEMGLVLCFFLSQIAERMCNSYVRSSEVVYVREEYNFQGSLIFSGMLPEPVNKFLTARNFCPLLQLLDLRGVHRTSNMI